MGAGTLKHRLDGGIVPRLLDHHEETVSETRQTFRRLAYRPLRSSLSIYHMVEEGGQIPTPQQRRHLALGLDLHHRAVRRLVAMLGNLIDIRSNNRRQISGRRLVGSADQGRGIRISVARLVWFSLPGGLAAMSVYQISVLGNVDKIDVLQGTRYRNPSTIYRRDVR